MEQFFIETETMSISKEAPAEDAVGKFAVVTSADELVEQFKKDQLRVLIASARGKANKGDESMSIKKLAFEAFKLMTKLASEKKKPVEKKEPRVTKVSQARDLLNEKGTIKKEDLAAAIGHDNANCHTMISILKNSARTKEPMYVAYNKATTEYTLCKTKEDMVKMEEGFVKAAIDVKAKADADAKAAAAKKETDSK